MDYKGNTFVGFIDISGFTKMVQRDEQKALDVLDKFYNSGYRALRKRRNSDPTIKGILISDCGVLFARSKPDESNKITVLKKMLKIINEINKELIRDNIMLTSSIAYGLFSYQVRNIVFEKVEKQFVCGLPYIRAYLDNSDRAIPKIRPGECRILIDDNFPNDVESQIGASINNRSDCFGRSPEDMNHYYYYWMCRSANLIDEYSLKYDDIHGEILHIKRDTIDYDENRIDEKYNELAMLIQSYSYNE
jgi:hypothetical protein